MTQPEFELFTEMMRLDSSLWSVPIPMPVDENWNLWQLTKRSTSQPTPTSDTSGKSLAAKNLRILAAKAFDSGWHLPRLTKSATSSTSASRLLAAKLSSIPILAKEGLK